MALDFEKVDLGSFGVNEEENRLRGTATEAFKINPDQHAKVTRLSRETNAPVVAIESNPQAVEQKLKLDQIDFSSIAENNPTTSKFISNFDNAVIAQDDIGFLQSIEDSLSDTSTVVKEHGVGTAAADFAREIPSGALDLIGGGAQGFRRFNEDFGRFVSQSIRYMGAESVANFLQKPRDIPIYLDPTTSIGETGELISSLATIIGAPKERKAFHTEVGSALGQIASFAASAGVTLPSFFLSSYAQGASEADEKGADVETQRAAGMLFGLTTLAAEKTGMDLILNRVPPKIRNTFIRNTVDVVIGAGIEGAEEWVEGVTHQLIAKGLYDPDAEIDLTPGVEEASAGTAAGIVRIILGAMGAKVRKSDVVAEQQLDREQQSITEQRTIDSIAADAGKAKINEIDKESFRQFVNEAGPDSNVFIDGEQAALYMQDKTPEEINTDPGLKLIGDQVQEAAAVGGDVVISVGDFAADIANTEHYDALRPSMTMSGESIPPFRQEIDQTETDNYIQKLTEIAQENVSQYVESQEIYNNVRGQLIDTGQMSPQAASVSAEIVPAWFTVHAQKTGVTVEQAYKDAGLTIEGPQTGRPAELGPDVLEQEKLDRYKQVNVTTTATVAETGEVVEITEPGDIVYTRTLSRVESIENMIKCLQS